MKQLLITLIDLFKQHPKEMMSIVGVCLFIHGIFRGLWNIILLPFKRLFKKRDRQANKILSE